jgi:hypothetical protein
MSEPTEREWLEGLRREDQEAALTKPELDRQKARELAREWVERHRLSEEESDALLAAKGIGGAILDVSEQAHEAANALAGDLLAALDLLDQAEARVVALEDASTLPDSLLARVAVLEAERDDWHTQAEENFTAFTDERDKAIQAGADLADAKEALERGRIFEREYQRSLGATFTLSQQERLDSVQSAFIDAYTEVLAASLSAAAEAKDET